MWWTHAVVIVLGSIAALAAPLHLVIRANSGPANDAELRRVGQGRSIIGAALVEVQVSEGFQELSEIAALTPEPPPWQALHRLMKERGWDDVAYALRVVSILDDGRTTEVLYKRRPCHDAQPATEEFLRLLAVAHGRITGDQVQLPPCEIDLRPDKINASARDVVMLLLDRIAPE
ncbi:hypothetical protein [Paludisphaera rhizosphaerae]|uniref:hypothetical protein n=1 Tax=Paludisphaera rhizosphaerae TaxID=2711216 RepID=UPI0013EE2384|nr:hypothetical protein [Paludisphaera rhizosphaerae]